MWGRLLTQCRRHCWADVGRAFLPADRLSSRSRRLERRLRPRLAAPRRELHWVVNPQGGLSTCLMTSCLPEGRREPTDNQDANLPYEAGIADSR
jgi:hypothetical protein